MSNETSASAQVVLMKSICGDTLAEIVRILEVQEERPLLSFTYCVTDAGPDDIDLI